MRITLVHSRFTQLGGAERYLLELAPAYAQAGHQVTILSTTPAPDGPWTAQLLPTPAPARLWAHPSVAGKMYRHLADLWPWRPSVAAQIAATTPDVVHLHNWHHIGAGAVRGIPREIPVVHTVHDFALADPTTTLDSQQWSRIKTAILRVRGVVLAAQFRPVRLHWPSRRTQRLLAAANPAVLRNPASIIPLSVRSTQDLARLADPAPRNRDGGTTFLFLGHLSQHKGLADLLAGWAQRPAAQDRLLIAGDGPLRSQVDTAAASDPSISYLGYLDSGAKQQALAQAQWVLFPSRWHENFSITCVEALAAGRPLISSGIARPPMASDGSVIVAGAGGSAEPAGAVDLAAALDRAAGLSPEQYRAYAQSARRDGQALGWTEHVSAMLDLLDQVVCKTSRHVPDVRPH